MRRLLAGTSYAWPAVGVVVLLCVLNTAFNSSFVQPDNWASLIAVAAPFVLVSMAAAPAILSGGGGIDLSVGPLAGLVNAVVVGLIVAAGATSPLVIIPSVLAIGLLSGLLNGSLIAYVRIPPIIATLGTYLVYAGLTLQVVPRAGGTAPDWLTRLAGGFGPFPALLLPIFAVAVLWLLLQRTAFRRNLFGVGGDARAAYTAGVEVARVRLLAYALSGVIAAVAGLAFTAVLGSADPTAAPRYTLIAIAGAALGGVSLTGGRGGLLGAAAGGAIIFLIQNLLTLAHVSVFHLQIVYGAALLLAVALNSAAEVRRKRRSPLQAARPVTSAAAGT